MNIETLNEIGHRNAAASMAQIVDDGFGVWELFLKLDLSSNNLKEISFVKGGSFRA